MSDQGPGGHAPAWYPDPMGRHEYRWFDGAQWTDQVSSHGRQSVDPVQAPAAVPARDAGADPARDLASAGVVPGATVGGGTLFTEPILVVNQKAKFIELENEYAISDQHGRQIGAVRQVGQSTAKKVMRALTSVDQFLTHKLQLVDASGQVVLQLTRPGKVMKSKIIVQDALGNEIGAIVQENMIGKIRFGLVVGGQRIGAINGENWRAWNWNIQDGTGTEVGRITKTWVGLTKAMFTTADNYVVQIHRPLDDPLRSLVVAAAVSVDTALKQDNRGFN
ncbi:MAG: phospholipid scramblase-related protein [Acidimicrobiales bacterium]